MFGTFKVISHVFQFPDNWEENRSGGNGGSNRLSSATAIQENNGNRSVSTETALQTASFSVNVPRSITAQWHEDLTASLMGI